MDPDHGDLGQQQQQQPPYFILYSHSDGESSHLVHPAIQYHYADDSPLALLPQTPDEHVIVLDFDPYSAQTLHARSLSKDLLVTGVKAEEAPGSAAEELEGRNNRMHTIQTIANNADQ